MTLEEWIHNTHEDLNIQHLCEDTTADQNTQLVRDMSVCVGVIEFKSSMQSKEKEKERKRKKKKKGHS